MNTEKRAEKKAARKARNKAHKIQQGEKYNAMMVALGKSLVKTETPSTNEDGVAILDETGKPVMEVSYDFPKYIKTTADGSPMPIKFDYRPRVPRLGWLGAKQYKQHGAIRKNRPGEPILHAMAIVEDASRSFAREVDKALAPGVPVVPMDAAPEAAKL